MVMNGTQVNRPLAKASLYVVSTYGSFHFVLISILLSLASMCIFISTKKEPHNMKMKKSKATYLHDNL